MFDNYTKTYLNMTLVLKNADLSKKNINRTLKKITGFKVCE